MATLLRLMGVVSVIGGAYLSVKASEAAAEFRNALRASGSEFLPPGQLPIVNELFWFAVGLVSMLIWFALAEILDRQERTERTNAKLQAQLSRIEAQMETRSAGLPASKTFSQEKARNTHNA